MSSISRLRHAEIVFLAVLGVCILSLSACGKDASSDSTSTTSPSNHSPAVSSQPSFPVTANSPSVQIANTSPGNMIKLKTAKIIDRQGTGIEAITMLVPEDWDVTGDVKWVLDNPIMPATVSFKASNPDGTEVFELFPSVALFWTDNEGLLNLFPEGSKYFGCEVSPLINPDDAFSKFIIPAYRSDVQILTISNKQQTQDMGQAASSQSPLQTSVIGGLMRMEYEKNGSLVEDEMFCKVEALYIPVSGMTGTSTNINWGITNICSFSTAKGNLDTSSKIFETISRSTRVNPLWFNKYNEVVYYLIQNQIQQIRNAGEFSRILSQTSDEISSEMMQSYENQQSVNDRIANDWDQYIRGVDSYYDPVEERQVELPAGYANAWTDGNGNFVVTDSQSYNPNIGPESNMNWQMLKKQ
jgi:hypothetical protein